MTKYLSSFKLALKQEFVYKLNFVLGRFRNIIHILVFFFLWSSVFDTTVGNHFGYTKSAMLTYAFLLILFRSITLSSKSGDIAGIISNGDLSNYLLKPISFFKYWLMRDFASKALHVIFSIFEIIILFIVLRPDIYLQTNPVNLLIFVYLCITAIFIFFNLLILTSFVPFWLPELGWGAQFLIVAIIVEFFSGAVFPLDIFPKIFFEILKFTPFPYLVYVPIKVYLGGSEINLIQSALISTLWVFILFRVTKIVWHKGLLVYDSSGR